VPPWQGFDELDKSRNGLAPLQQEIWRGFVFVRTMPGFPSVAEMMAPCEAEIAPRI
jgi:carnitine monooxygenase subunit